MKKEESDDENDSVLITYRQENANELLLQWPLREFDSIDHILVFF